MPGHKSTTRLQLAVAGLVAILGLGTTTPAWAIDCAKASDPIDKKICGNAGLKAADAAMGQAYGALVKTAPDPEIRTMLINSQRRWIAARNDWLGNGSGDAAVPAGEIRRAMIARSARLGDRSEKGLIAQAQAQRHLLEKYTGGAFAGFNTSCEFIPDDREQKHYSYECSGVMHVQNKDRVCSSSAEWASWSIYMYYGVSTVEGDKVTPVALCSDQSGNVCSNGQENGWTREAATDQHFPLPQTSVPTLDAENTTPLETTDASWFDQCLTSPIYPPAQ